jgi:hypothetical protein
MESNAAGCDNRINDIPTTKPMEQTELHIGRTPVRTAFAGSYESPCNG